MIVHRVLLPRLEARFKDPDAPAWYLQRIQDRIQMLPEKHATLKEFCLNTWGMFELETFQEEFGTMIFLPMFLVFGFPFWPLSLLEDQWREARVFLQYGRTIYEAMDKDERAALTGHE